MVSKRSNIREEVAKWKQKKQLMEGFFFRSWTPKSDDDVNIACKIGLHFVSVLHRREQFPIQ